MGKIFYFMGKSASGKDTIYKHLMEQERLPLKGIVPGTTRPIRSGEENGVDYFFYSEEELAKLEEQGRIIELRAYDTVHGIWKYFTADDQIYLEKENYSIIGTLESYLKTRDYFGEEALVPIYIYLDDGKRLARALEREMQQQEPKYAELCRRFLADEADFTEEKLQAAGIEKRFLNEDLDTIFRELQDYILGIMKQEK